MLKKIDAVLEASLLAVDRSNTLTLSAAAKNNLEDLKCPTIL